MTTLREAAQQALEALESKYIVNCGAWRFQQDRAITALRAALEQPSTAVRYSRKELNEFEQMQDGTWEADRNE